MGLGQKTVYLDVNGTDYSSKVLDVKGYAPLSDVSGVSIVLSNAGDTLKTAFTEHQVIAYASARSAFTLGDFFIGTDGAAPNSDKWTSGAPTGSVTISGNKLKFLTAGAGGDGPYAYTKTGVTTPYSCTVYVFSNANANADNVYLYGRRASDMASYWMLTAKNGYWRIYTLQSGAWAERINWGGYSANNWWFVVVKRTSATSITVEIYDVFGNALWLPGAIAVDNPGSAEVVQLGNSDTGEVATDYYDSFLLWSASTPQGEQHFEGYIDSVDLSWTNTTGKTITLICKGYESELREQYDESYGRVTGTFTPTYGATDDVSALVAAFLPSGWSYVCPDCAIHDKITISVGTRRIDAINELVDQLPYLGWFVLPMKCICFVMPDTSPAPDAWTEATTNWTTYGDADSFYTSNQVNIDGTNVLVRSATNIPTVISGIRRGDSLNIDPTQYRYLIMYYGTVSCDSNTTKLRLWTDVANSKYFEYLCPNVYASAAGGRDKLLHFIIRLPDSMGYHDWTPHNSPSVTDQIKRLEFESAINQNGGFYLDVLYFCAVKRLTSKYTTTNFLGIDRAIRSTAYTRVIVEGSGISAKVIDDTTMQSRYGLRELVINDQNVTSNEQADAKGRGVLNAQGWDDSNDPIQIDIVNPGDMYLVRLGDTLTVSAAPLNLTSATRTLIARTESFDNKGWHTRLTLSTDPRIDMVQAIWTAAKMKRY